MDTITKVIGAIIIGICICCGLEFGLNCLIYIIPILLVLSIIGAFWNNSQNKNKKITIDMFIQFFIGLSIVVFIIVGIGSCFHVEQHHNVIQQRSEMGLPMY